MEEAIRMMALFEGFDGAHGTHGKAEKNPDKSDKLEIKKTAKTVREPVTQRLWEDHITGVRPIGIIPVRRDNTCMWGCIDIDKYDIDHKELVTRVRDSRLPLVVCRTKSGGAHIYMFMSEPVASQAIQAKLRDLAAALGHGGCEIFPKQAEVLWDSHDLGNWLNMPYFGGDETERYGILDTGRGMTLKQFLSKAESSRITVDEMMSLRVSGEADTEFRNGPPCIEHLTTSGFPEGTRNNGLFAMGIFFKKKYPDKWEEMVERGNQKYFNPPLDSSEVQQICKSLRSRDYKYKCSDMPLANHCNSGACRTRKYGVGASGTVPVMESLAMLATDEPIYFLDVAGKRVELTTDELQSPLRFQKKCMETIHIVVPILKKTTWDTILQSLFENMTLIEAPPEISITGQFFEHLEAFCTDRQRAKDRDEIILGKAWLCPEMHRYYFRIRDVQEYLDRVKFRELTRSQITMRVRERGGGDFFFNIKGRGVNVFFVPESIFEVQSEPHDLPEAKEEVV